MSDFKVFCVGLNKSGTSTLGECLKLLGFGPLAEPQVLHDSFQPDQWREHLRRPFVFAPVPGQAGTETRDALDAPFGEYPYRAICDEVFDHANYGLALQIASSFRSFKDRPWNTSPLYQVLDKAFPGSRFILTWRDPDTWWRSVDHWLRVSHPEDAAKEQRYRKHFGADPADRVGCVAHYEAHNAEVRDYFAGRDDFLAINFERGEGWAELCPFLGVPIPGAPFPHANRQDYF